MTKKRTGQPRKRAGHKEEVNDVEPPKKETNKPLEFAVPEGGFDVAALEGYEFGTHQMLKKEDFQEEYLYFQFRAAGFRDRAEVLVNCARKWENKAEDAQRFGGGEERKQVKQLRSLRAKEEKLRNELEGKGIDVDAALDAALGGGE